MKNIVNDKENLDNITSNIIDGMVIRIFDFDGTLFNSPIPNPAIWDKKMIGRLMNENHSGGFGWFQNTITLDDKYIVNSTFNEDVIKEVRKSMIDPDSITVMLTGRTIKYSYQIKSILDSIGLHFDHYGFKPTPSDIKISTMQFKQKFINDLINQYEPDAIELWEDRKKHIKQFSEFINMIGLNGHTHFVHEERCYMPENLERELVDILKNENSDGIRFENANKKKPIYYGAFLYPDSHYELINQLGDRIPKQWRLFANHMTILFGKNKNLIVENYIKSNMNKDVILTAVKLGISNDAIAVGIISDVPSDNIQPHITVAVPPGGKPFNSNKITNWIKLDTPIILSAKINAFYGN